ncbi:MAG: S1C family serine protease [Planctomycetota bacterium]
MALSNPSSPSSDSPSSDSLLSKLLRNPSPPLVQRLLEIRRLGIRRLGVRQMALGLLACLLLCGGWKVAAAADPTFAQIVASVQPKVVKIYGAGGIKGLEAYQSGFLISAEGHVLTAWSYVLDTGDDAVTVILDDGRRFSAKLVGADPRLEVAVLKCEATDLPHFKLDNAVVVEPGARVLAFSNLFNVATGNEPASVLKGVVSAKTPLTARRGAYQTTYNGPVYVLDAMTNNPGAPGGLLTDRRGRLVGLIGKELRNAQNSTWLNYAVPIGELVGAVDDILAGKVRPRSAGDQAKAKKPKEPVTLNLLGLTLVPDVLTKTPPYLDRVAVGSVAAKAGLRADDLVLFVNERAVSSCKVLLEELTFIDRLDDVRLIVQRGQELVEVTLTAE